MNTPDWTGTKEHVDSIDMIDKHVDMTAPNPPLPRRQAAATIANLLLTGCLVLVVAAVAVVLAVVVCLVVQSYYIFL